MNGQPKQPHDPSQPMQPHAPQNNRRSLGRLILETPDGSREILSEVWSDQPLDQQGIMDTLTARVSGEDKRDGAPASAVKRQG